MKRSNDKNKIDNPINMMKPVTKAELKYLVDNWKELGIVLNEVDTTLITDMSEIFRFKSTFNEPLNNWNTEMLLICRICFITQSPSTNH